MKESKDSIPPAGAGKGPVKRSKAVKKMKERMNGNTVYSIGFRSGHKDDENERPPPGIPKPHFHICCLTNNLNII